MPGGDRPSCALAEADSWPTIFNNIIRYFGLFHLGNYFIVPDFRCREEKEKGKSKTTVGTSNNNKLGIEAL